jgi:Ca2+/Na+ antiporter
MEEIMGLTGLGAVVGGCLILVGIIIGVAIALKEKDN